MLIGAIVFGLFGLIVGSFLNVVVLRSGVGPITGRSVCMSCGTQIKWYDLIPVFSWFNLHGRCRACGSHISIQYPLVELSTAILYALIGGAPFVFGGIIGQIEFCIIAALLVAISAYDLRHTIIPDAWVYVFILLAFIAMTFPVLVIASRDMSIWSVLLAGPIAALPLFVLWLVSSGRWMGFGDVKLALGIGWLLGPTLGFIAIMFSFMIGAAVMLPLLLLGKFTHSRRFPIPHLGLTMKSEVPFGPFLIASCLFFFFSILYEIPLPLGFLGVQ